MYQPCHLSALPGNGLETGQCNRSQETPLHPGFFFPGRLKHLGKPLGALQTGRLASLLKFSVAFSMSSDSSLCLPHSPDRLLPLRSPSIDISDLQKLRESWKLETCAGCWLPAAGCWHVLRFMASFSQRSFSGIYPVSIRIIFTSPVKTKGYFYSLLPGALPVSATI